MLLVLAFLAGLAARGGMGKSEPYLLEGQVTDAVSKKPIAGVVVSLTGSCAQASSAVTTDAEGFFHFSQVPTCQINIQFDKKGYQPVKKAGVVVKEKSTTKLNIQFSPKDIDQEDSMDEEIPILRLFGM